MYGEEGGGRVGDNPGGTMEGQPPSAQHSAASRCHMPLTLSSPSLRPTTL